ncbi:hypothetical protein Tco_1508292 [Tanacetum coccineum]
MVVTANRIIRDPKLELESSRFTFDLVPLSYESVDVVVGENWLLRHKAEMVCHEKVVKMPWSIKEDECVYVMSFVVCDPSKVFIQDLVGFTPRRRIGFRMELVQGATPICEGSCRLTSLERQEVWNDCRSYKMRVGSNGGVRYARKDDHGVSEGREDVREVFQQRGSGAKRKLSRCGRNQMGNEPILALPEGADDFVVYYDARSKDLEACLEKGEGDCLYVATTEGRDYHSSMDVLHLKHGMERNVGYRFMGRNWRELWVVEGLTLERCSTFGKKDKLEPSYVGPFEILGWIGPIDRMSTSTQCCDMGSDGYAYPMYDMFGIVDPNMQNEVEFFEGWKPLSPLQLAVEEVMSE